MNYLRSVIDSTLKKFNEDKYGFIDRIPDYEEFNNPEDNYKMIKRFLKEEIDFLYVEVKHTKKWLLVYHDNVYKDRLRSMAMFEYILEKLDKAPYSKIGRINFSE